MKPLTKCIAYTTIEQGTKCSYPVHHPAISYIPLRYLWMPDELDADPHNLSLPSPSSSRRTQRRIHVALMHSMCSVLEVK